MLPFFRKSRPVVELLSYDDGVVGFACDVPLVDGQRLQVKCRLPDGEEFEGTLLVSSVGEKNRGVLEKPADSNQFLSVLLPPSFVERRAHPRLVKALRVLSRRVVGYKCTTIDLSPAGAGLLLDGPAMLGTMLDLEIDADMPGVRGVNLEAEVLWDLPPDANRKHRVGTRFSAFSPLQQRTLDKVLAHIQGLSQ